MRLFLGTTFVLLVGFIIVLSACASPAVTSVPSTVSATTTDGFTTSTQAATSIPPPPSVPDTRTARYAVIETSLEISHVPKLNEPATLSVTIISPFDVPQVDIHGLKAVIIFSRGEYELLDGNLILPVTIKAGEPIHFSAVIAFKEIGPWTVSACVEELVITGSGPAGMYFRSPEDTLFLNIGVDQSTVS